MIREGSEPMGYSDDKGGVEDLDNEMTNELLDAEDEGWKLFDDEDEEPGAGLGLSRGNQEEL